MVNLFSRTCRIYNEVRGAQIRLRIIQEFANYPIRELDIQSGEYIDVSYSLVNYEYNPDRPIHIEYIVRLQNGNERGGTLGNSYIRDFKELHFKCEDGNDTIVVHPVDGNFFQRLGIARMIGDRIQNLFG